MRSGFSLIELAMVLVITGIATSYLLSASVIQVEADKVKVTNERLDEIEKALFAYQQAYGDLPCPAGPMEAKTAQYYGKSNETSEGTCAYTTSLLTLPSTPFTTTTGIANTYVGTVPVYTLGLDERFMYDGWGNRIDYVVDAKAVDKTLHSVNNIISGDGSFASNNGWTTYGASSSVGSGRLTIGGAAHTGALSQFSGSQTYVGHVYKASYDLITSAPPTPAAHPAIDTGFSTSATVPSSGGCTRISVPTNAGKNENYWTITSSAACIRFNVTNATVTTTRTLDNVTLRLVNAVPGSSGPIDIYDTSDYNGTATSVDAEDLINSFGVYVLVSHGKNGFGAYNSTGSRNTAAVTGSTSEFEIENAHTTGTYDSEYRVGRANDFTGATNYFDDIVRWRNYEQLRFR